ncbi:MAG: hypothetical protein APF77_06655 [Clostridia bacterium BRH_c25]|nr:MAG: hypothetical protein APF77_06655 [Clostridia bacterium BRH_c25]
MKYCYKVLKHFYFNGRLRAQNFKKSGKEYPAKCLVRSDFEGTGSSFSLAAYFSDMPWEIDSWRKAAVAKACDHCNICINNCPTGAIRKESFLIDSLRCLSAINEAPPRLSRMAAFLSTSYLL